MNQDIFLMVIGIVLLIGFYVFILFWFSKLLARKVAKQRFFKATHSILKREESNDEAILEIEIIYKKLAANYSKLDETFKNHIDLLEDLFYSSESLDAKAFQHTYKIELSEHEKKRVVEIIQSIRAQQPYASVSSRFGNMMNSIQSSIETQNVELAKSNLRQLAEGVEILETTIRKQDKRNSISLIVSFVGVILTMIFGALSLLPYIVGLVRN